MDESTMEMYTKATIKGANFYHEVLGLDYVLSDGKIIDIVDKDGTSIFDYKIGKLG